MANTHECPRNILFNKYELKNKDTFKWWLSLFKGLEEQSAIPAYLRKSVLRKIFAPEILDDIEGIIQLVNDQEEKAEYEEISISASKTSSPRGDKESKRLKRIGKVNPYLRFFNSDQGRAAIWREQSRYNIKTSDLNEKSELKTEMLAVDFINWLNSLGGESKTTLDVEQIMKMFEVGFDTHAAWSLAVRVQELPTVPKFIANIRKQPHIAYDTKLRNKILGDIAEAQLKPRLIAFGKSLPGTLRYVPPKAGQTDRWLKCTIPEHISNMSTVWNGITDLRTTRSFCQWIMTHPEIPHPKYLEDLGMFSRSFYEKPRFSIDQESIGKLESSTDFDIYKTHILE